jgi:hypothetical protein
MSGQKRTKLARNETSTNADTSRNTDAITPCGSTA